MAMPSPMYVPAIVASWKRSSAAAVVCRTVRVYFIKPSKYDDRGRVAYFWKGVLPNNTLTVLAALNAAYKVALTATPVANRANTLYPILQFLAPGQDMLRNREWGELGSIPVRYRRDAKGRGSQQRWVASE